MAGAQQQPGQLTPIHFSEFRTSPEQNIGNVENKYIKGIKLSQMFVPNFHNNCSWYQTNVDMI